MAPPVREEGEPGPGSRGSGGEVESLAEIEPWQRTRATRTGKDEIAKGMSEAGKGQVKGGGEAGKGGPGHGADPGKLTEGMSEAGYGGPDRRGGFSRTSRQEFSR